MNIERLTAMANDIAGFFHGETDRDVAVEGISTHMRRYWEPRMRKQIIVYAQSADHGELSELAHAGVMRLAQLDTANA